MTSLMSRIRVLHRLVPLASRATSHDSTLPQYGSGAGKGGGAGGSVRESGGAFGIREAAMEEEYFRRLSAQQLEALHDHYVEEMQNLQKQMKELEETMDVQRQKLRKLKEITSQRT